MTETDCLSHKETWLFPVGSKKAFWQAEVAYMGACLAVPTLLQSDGWDFTRSTSMKCLKVR